MSFQNIRSAIGAKLQTLTWSGKPFACVYDHHKLGVEGYPAATFEPSSIESRFETNAQNFRTYAFDVVIHQEMSSIGRGTAISNLVAASDSLIDAFDEDYDLGGAVEFIDAVAAEFGEVETEDSVIAYAKITLRCNVLKNVTT